MTFISIVLAWSLTQIATPSPNPTVQEKIKSTAADIERLTESSPTKAILDLQIMIGMLDSTSAEKIDVFEKLKLNIQLQDRLLLVQQEFTKNNPIEEQPASTRRGRFNPLPGVDPKEATRHLMTVQEKNRDICDKIATYDGLLEQGRIAIGFTVVSSGQQGMNYLESQLKQTANEPLKKQLQLLRDEIHDKNSVYSRVSDSK